MNKKPDLPQSCFPSLLAESVALKKKGAWLPGGIALSLLFSVAIAPFAGASDQWGTVPLGKPVARTESGSPPIRQKLESRFQKLPAEGEEAILFESGQSRTILVIPAAPTEVEREAAELLKTTLEGMTGGSFLVLPEKELRVEEDGKGSFRVNDSAGRSWPHAIWIGGTAQARKSGLGPDGLRPEGYRLITRGPWLFILGNDRSPGRMEVKGTYFGTASLLENHFGVRWLWPGELGTILPKSDRIVLAPIHEQDEPAMAQRTFRNSSLNDRAEKGIQLLGVDPADYEALVQERAQWLNRHKIGSSVNLQYRHAYGNWYERFGKEHPDWFALQPNGSRVQSPERVRLCQSNPEVALQAAKQVLQAYQENPDLDCASISPNDGGTKNWFCMCEECRKLDPENAHRVSLLFSRDNQRFTVDYPSLTNRVVTFYNRIAEEVTRTIPNARVGAYGYSAYRDAPLGIKVHPAITIAFVGFKYEDENLRALDRERWDGWCHQASRIILRPNTFVSGDGLPRVFARRLSEDLKHCYQTGMTAGDFSALFGHWATDGLNYYLLTKLLWDPSADVTAIINDYCRAGFGPAAEPMVLYFAKLEEATDQMARSVPSRIEEQLREEERDPEAKASSKKARGRTAFQASYFEAFDPETMASLRGLLRQADEEAAGDEKIKARIALLRTGLDYAEIYRATAESEDPVEAHQKLLDWHREKFRTEPLAIGSVYQLWKTGGAFRRVK
ncbi:MAG TPA: DUF4838 domain-containing protein [Chthoniobacteraceae bacterium]|nr:DUF4838 domain-containing protein [Chthoniobacteraceae bacterium]